MHQINKNDRVERKRTGLAEHNCNELLLRRHLIGLAQLVHKFGRVQCLSFKMRSVDLIHLHLAGLFQTRHSVRKLRADQVAHAGPSERSWLGAQLDDARHAFQGVGVALE